ncbi:MAG TPA: phage tail protein [Vicinamibacterales bacterium]|jgi:phage tail-like protein|nr:phage tail protein [Vicinamibacterales bacterium]
MPPVFRNDPYGDFNFLVTINGISDDGTSVRGGFSEVTGLDVEIVPIEYRTGNETSLATRKLPGLHKFTNITLKRGVIGDLSLWNWINSVLNGNVRRADGSIVLLDDNRSEVLRWNFRRGWPCKLTGPTLNAKGNSIAMETLEICHEGLSIDGQA